MESITHTSGISRGSLWAGRIITGLVVLFFLFDSIMKLVKPAFVVEANQQLGYSEHLIIPIALVLLVSTILYVIPVTAVLGAILLTGYMGGAVATHVRVDAPLFNVVFAVLFGMLVWAGLFFREPRLKALLPLKQ
ncbi:MAG TPA: DoxX family protein [Pyrinomonadaceae bacterium]|nr:DoxX family protein [Pyrinomonadaceae bacterium]